MLSQNPAAFTLSHSSSSSWTRTPKKIGAAPPSPSLLVVHSGKKKLLGKFLAEGHKGEEKKSRSVKREKGQLPAAQEERWKKKKRK
jgi:hypothetical protein